MSTWLEKMFYAPQSGWVLDSLSNGLRPLGALYGWVSQTRLSRLRESSRGYRASVPVLSVGNYVVGGGGKTPMVIWLAQNLKERGVQPAVLMRGYGASGTPMRVQGELSKEQRHAVGDEAAMISERLENVPVFVGADRVAHARLAEKEAQIILLDDGLQHTALHRDWDVVCFKGDFPVGNGRCLPSGPLREPLPKNQPAHSTWVHYVNEDENAWPLANVAVRVKVVSLQNAENEMARKDQKIHLVCGVARPAQVKKTLELAGWDVAVMHGLADHQPLSQPAIKSFLMRAQAEECILVLTEKDRARLDKSWPELKNLFVLQTCLEWPNPLEKNAFLGLLDEILKGSVG